jgi:hypothetical protein
MKTQDIAALALNIALYVALGYVFFTLVPIKFEQVRFWPPVIVPAVFAVVFGPLVGGVGAAVGIFLSDMILGGNPLLSLMAGVTSNFAAFYLIGYLAKKRFSWTIPVFAYGIVNVLLMGLAYSYTNYLFMGIVALTYVVFLVPVVALKNSKWRSFEIGSIAGMLIGAAIIGLMVPVFTQFFAVDATPFTVPVALATFFFTFFTEIPFVLTLGPPIIWAIYRAFPSFGKQTVEMSQVDNVDENS